MALFLRRKRYTSVDARIFADEHQDLHWPGTWVHAHLNQLVHVPGRRQTSMLLHQWQVHSTLPVAAALV